MTEILHCSSGPAGTHFQIVGSPRAWRRQRSDRLLLAGADPGDIHPQRKPGLPGHFHTGFGVLTGRCSLLYEHDGSAIALVSAAVPLTTVLFDRFAAEARGYSMVVACIACAIVCYQRVPARRWTILLGLSLIFAESFHYFAVFAFLPFLLAEAVRYGMTR